MPRWIPGQYTLGLAEPLTAVAGFARRNFQVGLPAKAVRSLILSVRGRPRPTTTEGTSWVSLKMDKMTQIPTISKHVDILILNLNLTLGQWF